MRRHQNWQDTEDELAALATRFQDGEFSETVYRASLFAIGLRGGNLDDTVKEQLRKKQR